MAKTKKEVVEKFDEETIQHETQAEAQSEEATPVAETAPESYTVTFTVADIDRLFGFGEHRRYADTVIKTLISL